MSPERLHVPYSQLVTMSAPESSSERKRKELMAWSNIGDADTVIKSPLMNDPVTNPCIKEQNQSMKCILDNLDNKETACQDAYENYKLCKKFWTAVKVKRYLKGIRPILPPPEERESIKAEYIMEEMKNFKR